MTLRGFSSDLLTEYASRSWNAHHAVTVFGQLTGLLPSFVNYLQCLEEGLDDAQRLYGVVADLAGAMTGLPPTIQTLNELNIGLNGITELITPDGPYRLSGSPVLQRLDFTQIAPDQLHVLLASALQHDLIAKPLLDELQNDIHYFNQFEVEGFGGFQEIASRSIEGFPLWDDRPLFLEEQKALLGYLCLIIAAEIVADSLCDEPLGEYLLRASGVIHSSQTAGEDVVDINLANQAILFKPVMLLCHETGDAVLTSLRQLPLNANVLDVLLVAEIAVRQTLQIDISPALIHSRQAVIKPFDFPVLSD